MVQRIYISGPMRGIPDDNKKAFSVAAYRLRMHAFEPLNPAKNPRGLSLSEYMRIDLALLDNADGILLLPGWEHSDGAKVELAYAIYTGKQVFLGVGMAAEENPRGLLGV